MSINDKIKQILLNKGYSPSHFADEIGVQRSSISHILSGRNRPSFDIIQKIIKRFPDLGFDWILEDEAPASSFHRTTPPNSLRRTENYPNQSDLSDLSDRPFAIAHRPNRSEINAVGQRQESTHAPSESASEIMVETKKRVERILIFFTDGTFQEYSPS